LRDAEFLENVCNGGLLAASDFCHGNDGALKCAATKATAEATASGGDACGGHGMPRPYEGKINGNVKNAPSMRALVLRQG
jgi:hypothetical protein